MTKIKQFIIGVLTVLTIVLVPVSPVMAAPPTCTVKGPNAVSFFPAWYDGLLCEDGNIRSPGDTTLGKTTGDRFGTWLTIVAMNVVRMILYVVGYASLIFIIWGGFKYMINGDNSGGTVAARKTIQNAIIGLVLSIGSVAIVTFVVSRVAG